MDPALCEYEAAALAGLPLAEHGQRSSFVGIGILGPIDETREIT
jgi:hypothetical protein